VEYLGHIVSHEAVKVEPNKIKDMREWTIPKNLKKLRVFLGFTGYYCNIVKKNGQIATPITTLLKKELFSWTEETTKYFEYIKEVMCKTHVLDTPDFTKTFIVESDATRHGIGVVLMQEGRPIAFESTQLKGKNLNPFIKMKCWSYYMQLRNGSLT
jgi:hypothetical protein